MIGIDVGAPSKGYHAVALCGTTVAAKYHSCDPTELARWCIDQAPGVVSLDAPCRWRGHGQRARAAERELAADRISCFSTPTLEKARGHAFYTWMFAGQELYSALAEHYPIYISDERRSRVAVETFPQAVACALAGGHVSAKSKLANRTALLRGAGIDPTPLRNIDEVDAALCALAAQHFAAGTFKAYGDAAGGFIIVPSHPLPCPFEVTAPPAPIRRPDSHRAALAKIHSLLPSLTTAERQRLAQELSDRDSGTLPGSNTIPGFENPNGQRVERGTDLPGNDHSQLIYVLRCRHCDERYGANGSDIFQRKCPKCQGGRPGLAFGAASSAVT
jgi:predicted nuclease with RNAse H fold